MYTYLYNQSFVRASKSKNLKCVLIYNVKIMYIYNFTATYCESRQGGKRSWWWFVYKWTLNASSLQHAQQQRCVYIATSEHNTSTTHTRE